VSWVLAGGIIGAVIGGGVALAAGAARSFRFTMTATTLGEFFLITAE